MNKQDHRGETPVDWCSGCTRPGQKECLAVLRAAGGKAREELSTEEDENAPEATEWNEEEEEQDESGNEEEEFDDDE